MELQKKFESCENCGANDYKRNEFGEYVCAYCGTVYTDKDYLYETLRDESGRIVGTYMPFTVASSCDFGQG